MDPPFPSAMQLRLLNKFRYFNQHLMGQKQVVEKKVQNLKGVNGVLSRPECMYVWMYVHT